MIGLRKAQDMAFTNRLLSAPEALDWGLINRVVVDDELLDTAMERAENRDPVDIGRLRVPQGPSLGE